MIIGPVNGPVVKDKQIIVFGPWATEPRNLVKSDARMVSPSRSARAGQQNAYACAVTSLHERICSVGFRVR